MSSLREVTEDEVKIPSILVSLRAFAILMILFGSPLVIAVLIAVGFLDWRTILLPGIVYYTYVALTDHWRTGGDGKPMPGFSEAAMQQNRKFFEFEGFIPESLSSENMSKNDQFIFAFHPHGTNSDFGMLCHGTMSTWFPNLRSFRGLAASVLFFLPLLREMALWASYIDADRKTAERALRKGHSLLVVPGGEAEQMRTKYKEERVYLKKRKGFVKLAIKHGVKLVPAYVFGIVDTRKTSDFLLDLRMKLQKRYQIAIPLATGPHGIPFAPFKTPIKVVFGDPIEAPKNSNPDQELIDEVHRKYMDELLKVFEENKDRFGYGDRELIVE